MHLVVPASSRVRSISQLAGRTVSVGPSGRARRSDRRAPRSAVARGRCTTSDSSLDASVAALRDGQHLRLLLVRRPADPGRRRARARGAAAAARARRPARPPAGRATARLPRRRHPQRHLRLTRRWRRSRSRTCSSRPARRRGAGPACRRDAFERARRSPAPSRPPPRWTAAPRSRPRPCRYTPPRCAGSATPNRSASPPGRAAAACAAPAARRSARAACGRSRGRGPSRRRSGAGARARSGRRRGTARPVRGRALVADGDQRRSSASRSTVTPHASSPPART